MEPGVFSSALSWFYPSCEKICSESGIEIIRTAPPPLKLNERLLVIVGVLKMVGLHYVMLRPDGTYMDPADGNDYASFDEMNNSWTKSYSKTGLTILVER